MPNNNEEYNKKDNELGYHSDGDPTSCQIAFQDAVVDATNNYLIEMSSILNEYDLKHEAYTEDDYQLEKLQPIMETAIEKLDQDFNDIF